VGDQPESPVARRIEPPATATAPAPPLAPAARLRAGVRKPQNWLQLAKFCAVGGSGYVVNIIVFSVAVEVGDLHHLVAATLAFLVAVTNNFWWNRHWTFSARDGHAGFQAVRFLVVSVVAFIFAATVLELLVTNADMAEIPAQAISIVVATPLSFLGNKLWSFGSGDWRA
jgi:dolichol-phosphate mannosyltransferase